MTTTTSAWLVTLHPGSEVAVCTEKRNMPGVVVQRRRGRGNGRQFDILVIEYSQGLGHLVEVSTRDGRQVNDGNMWIEPVTAEHIDAWATQKAEDDRRQAESAAKDRRVDACQAASPQHVEMFLTYLDREIERAETHVREGAASMHDHVRDVEARLVRAMADPGSPSADLVRFTVQGNAAELSDSAAALRTLYGVRKLFLVAVPESALIAIAMKGGES